MTKKKVLEEAGTPGEVAAESGVLPIELPPGKAKLFGEDIHEVIGRELARDPLLSARSLAKILNIDTSAGLKRASYHLLQYKHRHAPELLQKSIPAGRQKSRALAANPALRVACVVCGASLAGMRGDAATCGDTCRSRLRRENEARPPVRSAGKELLQNEQLFEALVYRIGLDRASSILEAVKASMPKLKEIG